MISTVVEGSPPAFKYTLIENRVSIRSTPGRWSWVGVQERQRRLEGELHGEGAVGGRDGVLQPPAVEAPGREGADLRVHAVPGSATQMH